MFLKSQLFDFLSLLASILVSFCLNFWPSFGTVGKPRGDNPWLLPLLDPTGYPKRSPKPSRPQKGRPRPPKGAFWEHLGSNWGQFSTNFGDFKCFFAFFLGSFGRLLQAPPHQPIHPPTHSVATPPQPPTHQSLDQSINHLITRPGGMRVSGWIIYICVLYAYLWHLR